MKFKDKNGNIFIPTNSCTETLMKESDFYEEVKEDNRKDSKKLKKELAQEDAINELSKE